MAVIDKPLEWTSSDVVRKIKFRLNKMGHRKIKIGHAGTLDPLATGLLLVCIGKATKQVDALQAERKEYVAELMLGHRGHLAIFICTNCITTCRPQEFINIAC